MFHDNLTQKFTTSYKIDPKIYFPAKKVPPIKYIPYPNLWELTPPPPQETTTILKSYGSYFDIQYGHDEKFGGFFNDFIPYVNHIEA